MELLSEINPDSEQEKLDYLRSNFFSIFQKYLIEESEINNLFEKIIKEYQSDDRFYHNSDHIYNFLNYLQQHKENIINWKVLNLAVWFHDVIYDPKEKDNEEKSAQYARIKLKELGIPEDVIIQVEKFIKATKTHEATDNNDLEFFLDGDLAILGSDEAQYKTYAQKIRREYLWVPDEQYKLGRKKVLEKFLQRKNIFFTQNACDQFEEKARQNLNREIEQLN